MCIIAYKPSNKKMISEETLKTMFDNNPDGCGFMFLQRGEVHGEKGFMDFDSFYKALKKHKALWVTSPFVVHFRISTQAGVNKECTHPFPLSDKMGDLKKLKFTNDIGICHNGIISLTSSYSKKITHSDTMEFITDYLSLIVSDIRYWKDNRTIRLIERLAESKLAILDKSGHCELIGDFKKVDGIYYSNDSYKKRTYTYKPVSTTKCYATYLDDIEWDTDDYDWDDTYRNTYSCPAFAYDDYAECEKCPHSEFCWG